MRAVLDDGADMINDITALATPGSVEVLAAHSVPVVLMFSRAEGARADRTVRPHQPRHPGDPGASSSGGWPTWCRRGSRARACVIDPGMGFFLGSNPEPSLWVLKHLGLLGALGCPIYVSVSRKSFIGTTLGKPPAERQSGTLAAELWALQAGASYVRTHDVGAAGRRLDPVARHPRSPLTAGARDNVAGREHDRRSSIAGLFPPLPTPFREDGALDLATLQALLRTLNDEPLAGYLLGGSNGEFTSLSWDERLRGGVGRPRGRPQGPAADRRLGGRVHPRRHRDDPGDGAPGGRHRRWW